MLEGVAGLLDRPAVPELLEMLREKTHLERVRLVEIQLVAPFPTQVRPVEVIGIEVQHDDLAQRLREPMRQGRLSCAGAAGNPNRQ
jgi:hypothetical protein